MGERDRVSDGDGVKAPPWLLAASGELVVGQTIVLDPAEARHLSGSLRRRVGDEVILTDGEGWVAEACIVVAAKSRAEVKISSVIREPGPRSPGVTLAMAPIAGRNMDWAVQKAVEVGVDRFVPLETERAQVRGAAVEARVEHWRRISLQALKQCRRAWAMEIIESLALKDFIEHARGVGVVADRDGCAIDELQENAENLLVVGPEGGFTCSENELLEQHGWPRLRLGPHVMRAETAAIVGGAMMVARSETLRVESSES